VRVVTLAQEAVALTAEVAAEGGDFVLYRARLAEGGAEVVVKAARRPEEATLDRLEARLRGEADALARVAHPGVPRVHGLWRLPDGRLGLVRAWVPGSSLTTIIQRGLVRHGYQGARRWTPATRALVGAVGEALQAVHRAGLLHNDVKPDNVIVSKGADGAILASLVDFGEAGAEARGGTVHYASPERLEGRAPSVRSDVYALGVLIYELLSGTRPYPAGTTADALLERRHPVDRVPREGAARAWASFPPEVRGPLALALSPSPGRRPRSVQRLLKALGVATGRGPRRPAAAAAPRGRGDAVAPAPRGGSSGSGVLITALAATLAVLLGWFASPMAPAGVLAGEGPAAEARCAEALAARAERLCAATWSEPTRARRCEAALNTLPSEDPGACAQRMRELAACAPEQIGGLP